MNRVMRLINLSSDDTSYRIELEYTSLMSTDEWQLAEIKKILQLLLLRILVEVQLLLQQTFHKKLRPNGNQQPIKYQNQLSNKNLRSKN